MRTRVSSGLFARPFASTSVALGIAAAAAAGAVPLACSSSDSTSDPAPSTPDNRAGSAATATRLGRALEARFPAAFAKVTGSIEAKVTLPSSADRPFRVRDRASKIEVAVALEGASDAEAAIAGDLVVYEGAAPGDGDVVHRVLPSGLEDLVHFRERPAQERLAYALDLGTAAGLRLASDTLEILDEQGVPVLRAAPPYVIDAAGKQHAATLSVEGCAVDTDGRPPFRRAVTPPGSRSCTVVVDWSAARVSYPALVDPVWGSTFNTMAVARTRHTITLLNPTDEKSLALVAGGVSAVGGTPLKSAEIYDPLSRRFSSAGGQLNVGRSAHTATLLTVIATPQNLGPQEPVLIAGGADASGNPISSLEVYDPATGVFVLDANTMPAPRFEHAAVLIGDDKVLITGGTTPPLNQPTNTGYVYAFNGFDSNIPPTAVTSTLTATANLMTTARTGLAVTRLTTGQVLITGGFVLAGGSLQALQSAELFDPGTEQFGPIQTTGSGVEVMATQRGYHTSTALGTSGQVLVAGGLSKTVGGTYSQTVDIYADGSQGANKGFVPQGVPITMDTARANHSATLLPDGRVLVAGGFNGAPATAISSAEIFDPVASDFVDAMPLVPMLARGDFAALLVNAGDSVKAGSSVLVTGGSSSPTNGSAATAGAQILLRIDGDPCTVDEECLSGFCTDGVCCDVRCDEECFACSTVTKETGGDGVCGFAKKGSDPHHQCINQVETHTYCDGQGSTEQDPELTKSCLPASCAADGYCSKGCAQTSDCDASGWCDLTIPGEGLPGTCQGKKVVGAPCYGDDQCNDGKRCVDGVCCASDCTEQCQACDLPGFVGQCTFVGTPPAPPGDVHPNESGMATPPRTACLGFGENGERSACTGACTGVKDCSYPADETTLQADSCADDPAGGPSILTSYPCDGNGSNTQTTKTCEGFKCGSESACKTECTLDSDCITDFVCTSGACVALTGPLCDGKYTLRKPVADGGYTVCPDNYACPAGATACLTECQSIQDCVQVVYPDGTPEEDRLLIVCNGEHKCVQDPPPPVVVSCSASPASPGRGVTAWLACALVALLAARRRRP